ncbi:MAG: glycoside hydrolase family 2 protein [Bacteroidales bacterium]|nr:glycoside hydrolase family 2 protein [Bacteroidales bacterium]
MKSLRLLSAILYVLISLNTQAGVVPYKTIIPQDWKFRQVATDVWMPATVPGTVHTDLIAAGRIEDPYYRQNELRVQWIDKVNWEYKTKIILTKEDLQRNNIRLVFEGLDTWAHVYLNGNLLLKADNMFVTWRVDAKPFLKAGENELKVLLFSPVMKGLEQQETFGFPLPASNDQSETGGLGANQVSIFTRKAGYHFGWDWGPRLVTSGIWKPVYLESWDNARISDLYIIQHNTNVRSGTAELTAEIEMEASIAGEYSLNLLIDGKTFATEACFLVAGLNRQKVNMSISGPKQWWPNGLGEQPLYRISAELSASGNVLDSISQNIGLRTIKLIRKPDAKGSGESFFFEVNGRPVFAKGANYIPNDVFLTRVKPETYEFIVKSAAEANMNMLRVWGGGVYESDLFYDLCDKYGIMVWQDFMFACSMYPGGEEFLNSIRHEAEDNVKRLRNHACMALWCGNNEIEIAWAQGREDRGWGWKQNYNQQQRHIIWKAYDTIFHHILPKVVETYTDRQPYWHSSPSAGMGKLANDDNVSGDMHYWGVWHGQHPFSDFRKYKARFMSEYGFQSFPEFNSVKKYTVPEDWNIESAVMASHQRSGIGNLRIKQYMEQDYRIPGSFEHLLYVGQLLQANAIKMAMKTHRSEMPYCMGSLYWQINDCWPVASWSGIDYYGKWKALHYFAKEACKNQIINVVVEKEKLLIYGVSDLPEKISAVIRLNLADFNGLSLWNRPVKVTLPANNSTLVYSIDLKELPVKFRENEVFLTATLAIGSREIDQEFVYFAKPKDLKLPDPGLRTRISDKGDHFVIEIISDRLCKNLMLISDNTDVIFSDNYFDMQPGETRLVTCPATIRWEDFEKGFRVLHLKQTMR